MAYSLSWLPEVLLGAGLKVAEVSGWQTRGHGDVGATFGVLCHHTAGGKLGNMPSLKTLVNGRPDLPGPLCQLGLGRDGTYYAVAAGKAYHAGEGTWMGARSGNLNFIGIEAENTGLNDDSPWPAIQLDAYHRGVAAILKHVDLAPERCAGHKEWALPRGRKSDPNLDMDEFRRAVAVLMRRDAPPPVVIPRAEPLDSHGPGRPTLRRGSVGPEVSLLREKLGLTPDSHFDAQTEAAVREFQRQHGLVPDGIVGPQTWSVLQPRPSPGS